MKEDLQAVRAIGTNAIPYLLTWIQKEPSPWPGLLLRHLPETILRPPPGRLPTHTWSKKQLAVYGFELLGSNAASALPQLTKLADRPTTAHSATVAISMIGPPALPTFSALLADPSRPSRADMVNLMRMYMVPQAGTNTCIPTLLTAARDSDPEVTDRATHVLREIAPVTLTTNSPAQ